MDLNPDLAFVNAKLPSSLDRPAVIAMLNRILELELAGVVRYTHYALMVNGFGRIPIVAWLEEQASLGLSHAREVGELVTSMGGHPSLGIGPLLESQKHDVGEILRESLAHETGSLVAYYQLLALVEDRDVRLEDFARASICEELTPRDQVDKMLRRPGSSEPFVG